MRLQDLRRDAQRLHMEEGRVRCAVGAAILRRLIRSLLHRSGERAAKGDRNENGNHGLIEHGRLCSLIDWKSHSCRRDRKRRTWYEPRGGALTLGTPKMDPRRTSGAQIPMKPVSDVQYVPVTGP